MGETCFIIPSVKSKSGEFVDSKLFGDLWKISGNYNWADTQYKIATSPTFLSALNEGEAIFDKNGQIDAKSFLDITGITFSSDEIKEKLSKRWEDASLPTSEVSDRVAEFNSTEELKNDFVPVVEETEGEVVKFTIAQRTPERTAALQTYIENNEILKVISRRLQDLGVAYDFIGQRNRWSGRFSTENATKAFDGLYHLIEIADGADVQDTLVEEAAHLATLACKDSVFINRLLSAINEDTVSRLFSKDELTNVDLSSRNAKLELAGRLVAKYLKHELNPEYKGLFGSIRRTINKVFAGSSLSSLLSNKRRAEVMAERLAHGFLFDEEDFSAEEAIDKARPVTLYSSVPITKEAEALKTQLQHIERLGSRVKAFSQNIYNDVYAKLSEKEVLGDNDYTTIEENQAAAFMGSAVEELVKRLKFVASPLTEINDDFFEKEVDIDSINTIYEADSIIQTLIEISTTYNQLIDSQDYDSSDPILSKLNASIGLVAESVAKYKASIDKCKLLFTIQIMRESLGRDTIDLAADVFNGKNWFSFSKVRAREDRSYSLKYLAKNYVDELSDTNGVLAFFKTYSNQTDVTTQIFYQIVRQTKAEEAIQYNNEVAELSDIEDRWKKLIENKDFKKYAKDLGYDNLKLLLFERLDDGSLTGYFAGEAKWGQYYAERRDLIRKIKKEFLAELEAGTVEISGGFTYDMRAYKRLSKAQKHNVFEDYKKNTLEWIAFEDAAFIDNKKTALSEKYKDEKFAELLKNKEFKSLYDEIVGYKYHIDDTYLKDQTTISGGKSHGVYRRIPQFKADFINRLITRNHNSLITNKDLYDSRNLKTYCEDVTSDNFGSPITEDDALLGDEEENRTPDLRRLALYGIRELDNPQELSTNLFKSLEFYTEMACKFHTSQGVASKLELMHSQLNGRAISSKEFSRRAAKNVAKIASNKRETLMDRYIYAENDVTFKEDWKKYLKRVGTKMAGTVSAFGAIIALCISWMSGAKNYAAGMRVLLQDAASGLVDDVTLKDVLKQTAINWNPKHFAGVLCSVLYGRTVSFDHYQKLIDRWDSFRTPSKVHRRRGFHPLQTLVNIIMSNYSTTDNAIVSTIYYSKMDKQTLYDANDLDSSGLPKKIKATQAYEFINDNPKIREGLLKHSRDFVRYQKLKAAKDSLDFLIEHNKNVVSTGGEEYSIDDEVPELDGIRALNDFQNSLGEDSILMENGYYKSIEGMKKALDESIGEICFTDDDEFKICSNINDYIISSQGVYGMLNATEFQSGIYTQSLGKIKGYMFGLAQRNFFTNYNMTSGKIRHGVFDTERLALWSVFSGAKELAALGDITPGQYRRSIITMMALPLAIHNKRCVEHLQKCGWDPDQLRKLASGTLGWLINFLLGLLARALYRGNEKTIGSKVYSAKGEMPLKKGALDGALTLFTEKRYKRLIKPGVLFPEDSRIVDYEKADDQRTRWEKSGYRKNQRDPDKGYFEYGTQEWWDRYDSFDLKNVSYDTSDPLYYICGAGYRFLRGVRDEGMTLMDPLRFVNDTFEMMSFGNSIMVSAGISRLASGVKAIFGDNLDREKWKNKEVDFWLNKIGLTWDEDPDVGRENLQGIDWYGKQDVIDRYQRQHDDLPQLIY